MTTIEGFIYAVIQGVAEILPLGGLGIQKILPEFFGFPTPGPAIEGLLMLGTFLALFFYFKDDWASMISSVIQLPFLRKYPMTLDERLPFFLLLSALPVIGVRFYLYNRYSELLNQLHWVAGSGLVMSLIMLFSERMGRKNKGMFDWNWLDCLLVGIMQILGLIPGIGFSAAGISAGTLRNYNRESAAKYAFHFLTPVFGYRAFILLNEARNSGHPITDQASGFTLAVIFVTTLGTGLMAAGGVMKQLQKRGPVPYVILRILIGVGILTWLQIKG